MHSDAPTVDAYLASLPEERRTALQVVRETILAHLPAGMEETMNWGMITYQVPLSTCPDTYNGQPLMYAALASQKNHMAVYLTPVYLDESRRAAFEADYRATGKRIDMGRSCVRFRGLEDLPLDLIGRAVAMETVESFCAHFEGMKSARTAKPRRRR